MTHLKSSVGPQDHALYFDRNNNYLRYVLDTRTKIFKIIKFEQGFHPEVGTDEKIFSKYFIPL